MSAHAMRGRRAAFNRRQSRVLPALRFERQARAALVAWISRMYEDVIRAAAPKDFSWPA